MTIPNKIEKISHFFFANSLIYICLPKITFSPFPCRLLPGEFYIVHNQVFKLVLYVVFNLYQDLHFVLLF